MEKEYKHVHAFECAQEQIDQLKSIPAFNKTGFTVEIIQHELRLKLKGQYKGIDHDYNDGTYGDIFYALDINKTTVATGNIFDVLNAVQTLIKLYGLVYANEPSEPRRTDI